MIIVYFQYAVCFWIVRMERRHHSGAHASSSLYVLFAVYIIPVNHEKFAGDKFLRAKQGMACAQRFFLKNELYFFVAGEMRDNVLLAFVYYNDYLFAKIKKPYSPFQQRAVRNGYHALAHCCCQRHHPCAFACCQN